ncbi:MAG TPA: ABC transporter permease [Nitrososphaerales archaeon]|nr:ABC transporter permease [Nitrososphaerales archaeon]
MSGKPSTLSVIWVLVERDLRTLVKSPFILINRTIFFLIQLFVFAALVSKLATALGFNYFDFYSVGAVVSTITSIAFIIGEDLFEEEELGLLDYLLSLPFGHSLFVIGRALGGAVRGLIYVTPMMILVAYVDGYFSPVGVAGSLAIIFVLATGISGLSITLAMMIRNANRFDIVIALAELATVRVSAAIYPLVYMPKVLQPIASYSPVTSASDLVRAIVLPGYTAGAYETVVLLLFVGIFFGLGSAFLFRKIEGGRFE